MSVHSRFVRLRQQGLTLIELMVAMVIGLLLALAVFAVMSAQEGRKRSTTSVNDINQAGNYAAYVLDGWIRSAGSGFAQTASYAFGCKLYAAKDGAQILPRSADLPAPFASVNTGTSNVFRLAPILIAPDQTTPDVSGQKSDVLVVMGGTAGNGEVASVFTDYPAAAALPVKNTLSFNGDDLVLVADQEIPKSGVAPCMLEQVTSGFVGGATTSLSLSGQYYAGSIGGTLLTGYTEIGTVTNLGNVAKGNPPNFMVIGVGAKDTLYSYDLLQTSSTPLQAVADGVFELHALYGVDANDDGKVDEWVKPSSAGTYSLSALTDGSTGAADLLRQIKAVRVGLIMRTSLLEKEKVAPTSLTLFSDQGTSLKYARTLTESEQHYRYRTIEFSVPLRNTMMLVE